jgi:hypothetical protein
MSVFHRILLELSPFSLFSLLCLVGYIVTFTNFLTIYQIFHTWIHSLHCSPLFTSPIPGVVSIHIIYPFTYMCTQYLYSICTTPFPHLLPTSHSYQPCRKDLCHPHVLLFFFCLFICAYCLGHFSPSPIL